MPVPYIRRAALAAFACLGVSTAPLAAIPNPHESGFAVWGGRQFLTRPVVEVHAGYGQAVAVQDDGSLVAWGLQGWTSIPADLPPFEHVAVEPGSEGYLGVTRDSTLVHWGRSYWGFVVPANFGKVLDAGFGHAKVFVLRPSGSVWESSWFQDSVAHPELSGIRAIATNWHHAIALRRDGTVLAIGSIDSANIPPAGLKAKAIAVGETHSMALRTDGTVAVWGDTAGKNLSVPPGLSGIVAIRAGGGYCAALRADSTLAYWPVPNPPDFGKIKSFAVGGSHVAVVKDDGTVKIWVKPGLPELERVPKGFHGLRGFSAGQLSFTALRSDGGIEQYGNADQGAPPAGLGKVRSLSGGEGGTMVVLQDSTEQGWGSKYFQPYLPGPLARVRAVSVGLRHTLVLFWDGTVQAYGDNALGQGVVPVGLPKIKAIAAGRNFNVALTETGKAIAWGDTSNHLTQVPPHSTVVAIAAGGFHGLALQADGKVLAWGDTTNHAEKVPDTLSHVKAIAAGAFHSLALRENGTVVAWGNDFAFQSQVPRNLPRVQAIYGGYDCSAAVFESDSLSTGVGTGRTRGGALPVGSYAIELRDLAGNRVWAGNAEWTGGIWRMGFSKRGTWLVAARTPEGVRNDRLVVLR